jgi:hypothetical protein
MMVIIRIVRNDGDNNGNNEDRNENNNDHLFYLQINLIPSN